MSARYEVRDLTRRHWFIDLLRRFSRCEDFGLVYDTERMMHFACFSVTVWGRTWMLHLPVAQWQITHDEALGLIDYGNRMIADIEAHYRQQAVSR